MFGKKRVTDRIGQDIRDDRNKKIVMMCGIDRFSGLLCSCISLKWCGSIVEMGGQEGGVDCVQE
uniref:Bm7053 n=1 Tax=Brugia malayi TaxID=6279 RepID=A0A0I9N7N3_BRUMA|nr:Bm7053 [Brugia malayi]